ncbi:helix-turn-helix transcriptional regulator [Sporosarcina ureae]|uniref:helix-turn-helix transcriptional regulator n=1 Tax=Sporosarcina ureae TaxID=1571 RepID=UPI0026F1A179|nr:helix-turn-helix transcriptional regulator [Sporosarcina ureae]
MNLGIVFKKARANKTQIVVAKELNITVGVLSHYENNRSIPSLETFKGICKYYGLSADILLNIKDISQTPDPRGELLEHKLANIRDRMKKTQKEMASLIKVKTSMWSEYENGKRSPTIKKIQIICEKCKVSADYLIGINV